MLQVTRKQLTKPLLIATVVVMLTMMGTLSAHAAAQPSTYNLIVPLPNTVVDPCNGDTIQFTGYTHLLVHETIDNNGDIHITNQENLLDNHGVGLTGTKYVFTGGSTFTANTTNGANETTGVSTQILVSQGSTPNEITHFLFHFTFNANGVPTATIDTTTVECR